MLNFKRFHHQEALPISLAMESWSKSQGLDRERLEYKVGRSFQARNVVYFCA